MTVTAEDGTTKDITITINGTNDGIFSTIDLDSSNWGVILLENNHYQVNHEYVGANVGDRGHLHINPNSGCHGSGGVWFGNWVDRQYHDGICVVNEVTANIVYNNEIIRTIEMSEPLDSADPYKTLIAMLNFVEQNQSQLTELFTGVTGVVENIVTLTVDAVWGGNILQGTDEDDSISTGMGADVVYALAGNDTIILTADAVWDGNRVAVNVSNDSSVGTEEKINLEGLNRFNDVIDGGDDFDTIVLTSGNDAFFIDDVYSAHHSSLQLTSTTYGVDSTARMIDLETINAGEGNDIVDLTSDNFVLANGVSINGEEGNDTLWGSNGDDVIDGGEGNDTLFGGAGDDTLTGGDGDDVFHFTPTAGSNVISDFDVNGDSIKLYYGATDKHTNADIDLTDGILTWDAGNTNNVLIDISTTTTLSGLNDIDSLITFVEIV